jgi:DnaJ-class molecular chaperone
MDESSIREKITEQTELLKEETELLKKQNERLRQMITKVKCETCDGTGLVKVLMNADGYYVYADEPIIETLGCEDCGGTGYEHKDPPETSTS